MLITDIHRITFFPSYEAAAKVADANSVADEETFYNVERRGDRWVIAIYDAEANFIFCL